MGYHPLHLYRLSHQRSPLGSILTRPPEAKCRPAGWSTRTARGRKGERKGPADKYFPPWLAIQPLLQILGSAGMKAGTVDAQEWLCANKTLFAKTGAWLILAQGLLS